ncbi:MAG: TIGR03000 domain-containing protein, partial [Planctomycetota bacterium]
HGHHYSHYSSGGSSGSYGSSGGSYGSSGSSGGSSGGGVMYSSPIQSGKGYDSPVQSGKYYSAPIEGGTVVPETPPAPAGNEQTSSASEATLTVNVPNDARVYVNGVQTKSVGPERSYVSRGLQNGFNYTYEVRAEVEREGKMVEETKMVSLTAGRTARVAFDFQASEVAPSTTLTLNVPADAKVFLAGSETTSSGEVREFTTTKLAAGQSWDNYTIRVTFEQDGQTISREKTITLSAGDSQVVSFETEGQLIASAN